MLKYSKISINKIAHIIHLDKKCDFEISNFHKNINQLIIH